MTDTTMDKQNVPEIPEERRFVWRNLDAFLAGELSQEDRNRIEAFLCDCPYTKEYVETEREFAEAVKRCVNEAPAKCPESLRSRVLTALEHCEVDDEPDERKPDGALLGFPWLGAVMMAAASIMLVVALVLFFGGGDSATGNLPEGLQPMVAGMSMDVPKSESCRYGDASKAYAEHFSDAPELPHMMDGKMMQVSDWSCDEVDGSYVMRAIYDAPSGERFGLIVFDCDCLNKHLSEEMKSVEVVLGDKIVLLWREGNYFRALVGKDAATLQKQMQTMRKSF